MPTDLFRSERDRSPDTLLAQVRALWLRQSGLSRLLAALVVAGLAGATSWMALSPRATEWVLATKIEQERQALMAAALLDEAEIPSRRQGTELLVPAEHLARAHRLLAENPEPLTPAQQSGGWGSVLGDAPSPKAQLERELAESLMRVTAVRAARVHLSLGRKSPFRDRALPPSASVLLRLHEGTTLTPAQAEGIRELVARSLEGASPKEITLLDQNGRSLTPAPPTAQEARASLEAECNAKVRAVLEPVLGVGRVVSVATVEPATATSAARTRVAVLVDPEPRGADHAARLERWTQLARDAVGIDEARGDMLTLELATFVPTAPAPSATPAMASTATVSPAAASPAAASPAAARPAVRPTTGFEPDWRLVALAGAGLALALALLAALAWLRLRRYRRLLAVRTAQVVELPAPPVREPAHTRLEIELARTTQVVSADPEATALVLSSWLTAGAQEPRHPSHPRFPESSR